MLGGVLRKKAFWTIEMIGALSVATSIVKQINMSVLLIAGPKCTLAALHAVPGESR